VKLRFVIAATTSLLLSHTVSAAEIKVLASGATKEICLELIPSFEKSSGHKVIPTWAGTADIKKRIASGEVYDIVVVAAPEIDTFNKQGKMMTGSRTDLMKSAVGVAVRAGAPKPDIGSSEALKKTLLAAKSIGYSTGPNGVYMARLFERMGIADVMIIALPSLSPTSRARIWSQPPRAPS
jgi:molybdate transport system substrate-binding protein